MTKDTPPPTIPRGGYLTINDLAMGASGLLSRSALQRMLTDPRRDIDHECGYPIDLSAQLLDEYYRRSGIGTRVVNIFPDEGWKKAPEVYESEDPEDTAFEKVWKGICKRHKLVEMMKRSDTLCGIGRFGVLLLGFDDGATLDQPVESFQETFTVGSKSTCKLLYVRAFPEKSVDVSAWEDDVTNPRFGLPKLYTIQFIDPNTGQNTVPGGQNATTITSRQVHWHRIIHVADNCQQSDIYGSPRMEDVFDRLYDLKKILGGGSEMFWKGGFPGLSLELASNVDPNTDIDKESLKAEFEKYSNGLQRYMALTGMTAKSLSPQVADPNGHMEANIKAICITKGIPYRIFMGTEEGQLAGEQDNNAWLSRVAGRRELFQTPHIVRPVVDRLIQVGVLPCPVELEEETGLPKYEVYWPDLTVKGDQEKATVAKTRIDTVAAWSGAQLDTIIPPTVFFTQFCGMSQEEAESIVNSATEYLKGQGEDADLKKYLDDQAKAETEANGAPPAEGSASTGEGEEEAAEGADPSDGGAEEEEDPEEEEPATHGGSGSGNFGHGGRPGERGGSSGDGGGEGASDRDQTGSEKSPQKTYTKLDARQAKKVNLDKAQTLLRERGMSFDFMSSEFDHATKSTSYKVKDRFGKEVRMSAKDLGKILTTDRDRL